MANELFSLWGFETGWRSQRGAGYEVTADLDGVSIWYFAADAATVERQFYRACRRTFLRRVLPWLAPPAAELGIDKLETTMTMPSERTRAVLHTKEFLEDLMSPARMPGVPEHVREEARRLLRHYPGPVDLAAAHRGASLIWGPVPGRQGDKR